MDCGKAPPDLDPRHKIMHKRSHKPKKHKLGHKRVVGGKDSRPGAWPWQVLLQWANGSVNNHRSYCGGAILSKDFVLTAAHCQLRPQRGNCIIKQISIYY